MSSTSRGRDRRLPVVGVMGSGTRAHADKATGLGRLLARQGVHLLTGGGGGVMAAVAEAFVGEPGRTGKSLGVLPAEPGDPRCGPPPGYPNPWIEIVVRTHLPARGDDGAAPDSRNHVNVLSADVVVALPGGSGTASEVQLALRYGRPVIAFVAARGEIPGLPREVPVAVTLAEVERFLVPHLGRTPSRG